LNAVWWEWVEVWVAEGSEYEIFWLKMGSDKQWNSVSFPTHHSRLCRGCHSYLISDSPYVYYFIALNCLWRIEYAIVTVLAGVQRNTYNLSYISPSLWIGICLMWL
jgi:hypothetical protein